MKFSIILLCLFSHFVFSQDIPSPDPIETFVEREAEFPGGSGALAKFINDNIVFPQEVINKKVKGRVTLRFVVEQDGSITNVSVTNPIKSCDACSTEAINVVTRMPNWKPGSIKGKEVRTWVMLPIRFE